MIGERVRAVLLALAAAAAAAQGATIRAVGALGNSGQAGPGLLRCGPFPLDGAASGAAIDRDWTLWVSGGDRINRVGLDGRLVESFPLQPPGSTVDSRTFAVLDATLYFLGRRAGKEAVLFALPMRSGATARPLPVALPQRKRRHLPYCLAPQPLRGSLVLATEPKEPADDQIAVFLIDPKARACRRAFTLDGSYPHGVAVDERRGVIYVGANFGLFVGGVTHGQVYAITAVRPDGRVVSEAFPAPCTKTPATPTQFRGVVSLAAGALWDSAWYGFLARLDLEGRGAPGRIVEWHHELDYPTQVLGLLDGPRAAESPAAADPLVIATRMPDACYFALWERAGQRLRLVRRIGCLPVISSLGLAADGRVTVGTARAQLWWAWDDRADAPPRKAGLHVALTPPLFQGERFFAVAAQYRLSRRRPSPLRATVFTSRPGGRNEARRFSDPLPFKTPVGLAVRSTPGKHDAVLFVTDAAGKQLWRADFSQPTLQPKAPTWRAVPIDGHRLRAPGDLAALTDGRLLLADAGQILLLAPRGDRFRVLWRWDRWGTGTDAHLGPQVRFAVDGRSMLIADTGRHRVVWLDWADRRMLACFGQTDRAGGDGLHLSQPTFVALQGTRALVADAANQRILKLTLHP